MSLEYANEETKARCIMCNGLCTCWRTYVLPFYRVYQARLQVVYGVGKELKAALEAFDGLNAVVVAAGS